MVAVELIKNLPKFKKPPVVELVLGVQFARIEKLNAIYLGAWWQTMKNIFPVMQEKSALPPIVEPLDLSKPIEVRLNITNKPTPSRWWFLTNDHSELIQVQNDRFVYNWRKTSENMTYPSYEHLIENFLKHLHSFCEWIAQERLGPFDPNMCEISYVNHIFAGKGWEKHSQLADVYAPFSSNYSIDFLPPIETFEFNASHVFTDKDSKPLGRLKIGVNSGFRGTDQLPVIVINMNAFSPLQDKSTQGIKATLDKFHEWTVRGFATITTPKMHEIWGRYQ